MEVFDGHNTPKLINIVLSVLAIGAASDTPVATGQILCVFTFILEFIDTPTVRLMIQTPARGLCVVLSHLELAVVHVMLQDFQSHFSLSGKFICFTDNLLSMCFHDASFLSLPVIIP